MPRRPKKTGLEKLSAEPTRDAKVGKSDPKVRAEVNAVDVDRIVRTLDAARVDLGMSKAKLAALLSSKPEIVRLFSSKEPSPTLSTLLKLGDALGLKLRITFAPRRKRAPRRRAG